jgi:four helix bundle protein
MSDTSPFAFQESDIWQRAMTLAEHVYAKTERFPLREHAGLAAHMREAAQKIAATIASNHFHDAQANAKMLFTQATLAARLGHLDTENALSLLVDIEALSAALPKPTPRNFGNDTRPKRDEGPSRGPRRDASGPRNHDRKRNDTRRPEGKRPDKRSREAGRTKPYPKA